MDEIRKVLEKHRDKFSDSEWRDLNEFIDLQERINSLKTATLLVLKELMRIISSPGNFEL